MIWLCKDAIADMAALQSEKICELLMVLDCANCHNTITS